ncbi:hypothetical protein AB1285_16555 [Microbacterium sp. NRRL B-14842]
MSLPARGEPARMGTLRAMLVLGMLEAFGPLSMDLYLPQLPQLAASLGTTEALAQVTMSACMIGLGLGQLVAGPLSDRLADVCRCWSASRRSRCSPRCARSPRPSSCCSSPASCRGWRDRRAS